MTEYLPPLRDIEFTLNEIAGIEALGACAAFSEFDIELYRAILEEAGRVTASVIAPTNREGDEAGCVFDNGAVRTPPGFKAAYDQFAEGGWIGLSLDPAFGGQGLPHMISVAVSEMMCAANTSLSLYPGLTRGVFQAIWRHGSEELKSAYLEPLASGRFTGTMCLSEPQAGSDIGATRAKAMPREDGTYRLEGSKIWITGGEHDLTEQVIHLVLARLPDAPAGTRGLSLFLVPKLLMSADGTPGQRNSVSCAGIEHKMGINGSATCVLNFDGATAYLVGEENRGMHNMFTVMNYERFEIGLQGLGLAENATQNAIRYARERVQSGPIIDHPDVRRMLFTMKAYTEGMRMMAYWIARAFDEAEYGSQEVAQAAQDRVDLMIPVAKALFSDLGVEVASLGVQVYGGVGYVREYGMEQNIRDARIGPIYEGTNGIQALDLVGRKLSLHEGRLWKNHVAEIEAFLSENQGRGDIDFIVTPLRSALQAMHAATAFLTAAWTDDPIAARAGASDYLRGFGLVTMGYLWARAARLAAEKPDAFNQAKLATAEFFAGRLLLGPAEAAFRAARAGGGAAFVLSGEAISA